MSVRRMRPWFYFRSLLCGALGCSAAGAEPRGPGQGGVQRSATTTAPTPNAGFDAPTSDVRRIPVGSTTAVPLAYRLLAIEGAPLVLVVAEEGATARSHVRSIDAHGSLSPIRTLGHRHVAAAVAAPDPRLVTSDGSSLRVEALNQSAPAEPLHLRADAVVALGHSRLAFLEERDESSAANSPAAAPAKRERPKREHAKKPAPIPSSKPTPVRLWLHAHSDLGGLAGAVDTGVAFGRPMPGMGLVTAVGTTRGARALWYEPDHPQRMHGRFVPFAQLMSAELDLDGKLRGTASPVVGGPREFGWIEGHLRPRLFGSGDASVYVGRRETPVGRTTARSFEAVSLGRSAQPTGTDALWVTDPRRALVNPPPHAGELTFLERIVAAAPELVVPQSAEEPGRVAWAGTRGFFLANGRLMSADRVTHEVAELPHPFTATRATLAWSAVDGDGSAIAAVGETLFTVERDGTTRERSLGSMAQASHPPWSLARIGDTWWGIVPTSVDAAHPGGQRVVRIDDGHEAAGLSKGAFSGSMALVGGADAGLVLALDGGDLVVTTLGADGTTAVLSRQPAPVKVGFSAAARAGGGALLVGVEAARAPAGMHPASAAHGPSRALAFALDATGALVRGDVVALELAPGRIGLASMPTGGAVVWAEPDPREPARTPPGAVWLDLNAHAVALAAWPAAPTDRSRSCSAGRPVFAHIPSPQPGQFLALTLTDACAETWPTWTSDGLRWFGTREAGIDASVERVDVPFARIAAPVARSTARLSEVSAPGTARCPPDMVLVRGTLCVDSFESQLVDAAGLVLSPYYATQPAVVKQVLDEWTFGRLVTGDLHARAMPLPPLLRPALTPVAPVATSRPGVLPNGYLSGVIADAACRAGGKRLCSIEEWTLACRGEDDQDFPYGNEHEQGACNVNRYAHPAATLHGNAALGHLDPRLNLVKDGDERMLRPTGSTPRCVSRWGKDGIYDMVGNLDEWLDDEAGSFAGGFYARSTRRGCSAVITVHPRRYFDYSLGTRCCLTP